MEGGREGMKEGGRGGGVMEGGREGMKEGGKEGEEGE